MVFNAEIKYTVKPERKPTGKLRKQVQGWRSETFRLITQIPGPVKTPIRWTSPKQRRFVMGYVLKRDAGGNIIPTQRTGRVAEWQVLVDYDAIDAMQSWVFGLKVFLAHLNPFKGKRLGNPPGDGILVRLANPTDYWTYVTGGNQQGFHIDTGWVNVNTIIAKQFHALDNVVQDTGFVS